MTEHADIKAILTGLVAIADKDGAAQISRANLYTLAGYIEAVATAPDSGPVGMPMEIIQPAVDLRQATSDTRQHQYRDPLADPLHHEEHMQHFEEITNRTPGNDDFSEIIRLCDLIQRAVEVRLTKRDAQNINGSITMIRNIATAARDKAMR